MNTSIKYTARRHIQTGNNCYGSTVCVCFVPQIAVGCHKFTHTGIILAVDNLDKNYLAYQSDLDN